MAPVAVLGAGGGTGLECVKTLLEQGREVRAVVRDPAKYEGKLPKHSNLQVVQGDVTSKDSLAKAFQQADSVIFAASGSSYFSAAAVDFQGVQHTAEAAKQAGLKRVVLVSSGLVTPKNRFHPIRLLLNNVRWGLMDNKYKGEQALRKSGVPYTVVRPGGLTNAPAGQHLLVAEQGDKKPGRVSRADVAAVCVAALSSDASKDVTFELKEDSSKPAQPGQLAQLFGALQPNALYD
jgi:uncharacterized protein YbjT (DUF2867 family)